jgi:BASS family bile acid:Na+ symporter
MFLIVVVVLLMLGLGSTLDIPQLKYHAKRPKPVLIGLLSQFGLMPLIAFTLASILPVSDAVGLSIILIGKTMLLGL